MLPTWRLHVSKRTAASAANYADCDEMPPVSGGVEAGLGGLEELGARSETARVRVEGGSDEVMWTATGSCRTFLGSKLCAQSPSSSGRWSLG